MMKPTIKDIAAETGFSIATVSRVLAEKRGSYSDKTRDRVLQVAKELGYRKNTLAMELVKKKTDVIAVIVNVTPTNFSNGIIDGIQERATALGQQVIILYAGNRNHALQHQAIITALERSVSGILLMAIEPDNDDLRLLTEARTPFCFVSVNLADERIKSVSSDNYQAAYQATEYLIAHGHRRIGLVGIDQYHTGSQRRSGYQAALKDNHIQGKAAWIQMGDYSYQAGQAAFKPYQQMAVTGVVAASDMTAAGLQKAAQINGLELPTALSVVSIDGTLICDIATPALTSITQDFTRIGIESVNCLIGENATQLVPVTLTERDSVMKYVE
ncbi:LacI family DNA-binding transcriptional regulator [Lactiplantibacillus pentosus]